MRRRKEVNKFFNVQENFEEIIKENLKEDTLVRLKQIETGWTNIVFEAIGKENTYFFRFPRNDFWAKMILKDCAFAMFIYNKTSLKTPEIKLYYDNGRPFTMHKKIEGICLTEKLEELSYQDMKQIAQDITKFINELSHISKENLPTKCNVTLLEFLDELAKLHFVDSSLWRYEFFKSNHMDDFLVHGDLNPGNIIVNNENQVIAVIDFCFAGIGNPYADISRIIGRSPLEFKEIMIREYEGQLKTKLNRETLDKFIQVWEDIDQGYIGYIRKNSPDIILPEIV